MRARSRYTMSARASAERESDVLSSEPLPPSVALAVPQGFAAFASSARLQILEAVTTRGMTILELTQPLRRHRATVRYHLARLLQEGLVEETRAPEARRVGRPALLYRAARHGVIQGFPKRHYEVLAEVALRALVSEAGPERATVLLREMGVGVGRSMVESIAARAGVREWTPEAFQRHFLEGAMRDFGIASTILSRTSRSIEYRCFTCPFLEAAEKMSDLVCDSLDVGFHQGVNQAMGRVTTERIACMGHGSPFCQYRVVWRAAPARRRRSRTTGGV